MRLSKSLLIFAMASIIGAALSTEARASVILTAGNNPQDDENILLNTGAIGNPIFGETNQTNTTVEFWSIEDLKAPSNGQARVEGADGLFTELGVRIPAGSFRSLILNLDATANGTVDFTATDTDGNVHSFTNRPVGGNGANFFTFSTDAGTRIANIYLIADVPIAFVDGAQFRIGTGEGDTTSTDVPEPVTLLLFGTALAGAGWRMRRRSATN
jgi:hypothetical protein